MTIRRTILIYLQDANPKVVKICEVFDSIVKIVSIPEQN